MAEHKHGEMNIEEQEKTFRGFISFSNKAVIATILVLIFTAMVNA